MANIKETLKRVATPINSEGYNIIILTAVVTALLAMISHYFGFISFIFLLFCIYFFRDPERFTPDEENAFVAPADGVIDAIEEALPPAELEMDENIKWTRISTFLSIFNVHAQRIPFDGKITKLHYREGAFLNVSIDKYSKDNERQSCVLETKDGLQIPLVQIAGFIARRIVCNLSVGQEVKRGDKYGIIKFGSRVDIYLPKEVVPCVKVGQTMVGGETIIAKLQ